MRARPHPRIRDSRPPRGKRHAGEPLKLHLNCSFVFDAYWCRFVCFYSQEKLWIGWLNSAQKRMVPGGGSVSWLKTWSCFTDLDDFRHRTGHLEPGSEQRGDPARSRVDGDGEAQGETQPRFLGEEDAHRRRHRGEVRAVVTKVRRDSRWLIHLLIYSSTIYNSKLFNS